MNDEGRDHLAPWLPWATSINDVEETRRWLKQFAEEQAKDRGRMYGIWLDGVLVGGVLFQVFRARSGICEVGAWLAPEAEGRGLVTAAVRRMVDWAFQERGMARVEWRTEPTNLRSIAVAKRLGMTREGVLRDVFRFQDGRRDLEVWSLLASEYRGQGPEQGR
ncbi:GNAT family protein [Kitasatospora sp. GP82]|uniref:GNAT family N-acetyltransferase n=1 Tax=Kitasatospora sp. GP82 TaxID=3035089 RepID=UPI0024737D28|nr:GNAT family protein [Kitasatospora sp. GP82]